MEHAYLVVILLMLKIMLPIFVKNAAILAKPALISLLNVLVAKVGTYLIWLACQFALKVISML